jgi:hypothetical protein
MRKVAYTKYDATGLVHWSNYTWTYGRTRTVGSTPETYYKHLYAFLPDGSRNHNVNAAILWGIMKILSRSATFISSSRALSQFASKYIISNVTLNVIYFH